jgi:hypothetical protein
MVDDLDGTILDTGGGKKITFSVGDRAYEIDFSDENANKF